MPNPFVRVNPSNGPRRLWTGSNGQLIHSLWLTIAAPLALVGCASATAPSAQTSTPAEQLASTEGQNDSPAFARELARLRIHCSGSDQELATMLISTDDVLSNDGYPTDLLVLTRAVAKSATALTGTNFDCAQVAAALVVLMER